MFCFGLDPIDVPQSASVTPLTPRDPWLSQCQWRNPGECRGGGGMNQQNTEIIQIMAKNNTRKPILWSAGLYCVLNLGSQHFHNSIHSLCSNLAKLLYPAVRANQESMKRLIGRSREIWRWWDQKGPKENGHHLADGFFLYSKFTEVCFRELNWIFYQIRIGLSNETDAEYATSSYLKQWSNSRTRTRTIRQWVKRVQHLLCFEICQDAVKLTSSMWKVLMSTFVIF